MVNALLREIEAYNSIKGQQAEIERLLDQDHKHWVEEMINTFQIIASGIMDCDVSRTNMGLLRLILRAVYVRSLNAPSLMKKVKSQMQQIRPFVKARKHYIKSK